MTDLERAKAIVDEFNSPPIGAYYTRDALVGMISRALKEVREESIEIAAMLVERSEGMGIRGMSHCIRALKDDEK